MKGEVEEVRRTAEKQGQDTVPVCEADLFSLNIVKINYGLRFGQRGKHG